MFCKSTKWGWTSDCRFEEPWIFVKEKENKEQFTSIKLISIPLVSPAGWFGLWFDFDLINSTQ